MEEITENQIKQGTAEDSGRTGINSDHEAYQLYRKINIYDTVFKLFFQDLENVRKFYESLTNRNIRVENIEKVTLEEGTSFDSQLRNDLGFIVKNDHAQDEFVILTEAQSTWNDNMPYRFLEYVTANFREYIKSHKELFVISILRVLICIKSKFTSSLYSFIRSLYFNIF